MLDREYQIILANWPSYKKIMCVHNNNIPINIPSHPYVLMKRSILCNCDVEDESNFLLESLAVCENSEIKTDLEMYFTVNLTFVNYFDEAIEDVDIPILKNWTSQEQILPISVETFGISPNLLNAPKTLKDLVNQYKNKQKILETKGQKEIEGATKDSKFGSFLKSCLVDVFLFSAALITMIITLVVIYMACGQSKLKALVSNIALQCAKGIEAADMTDRYCLYKTNWYIVGMLLIIMIGIIYLVTNKIKKSDLFKGQLFPNVTKVMLFISNTRSYVPIKLCRIAGSIHLFRIRGRLTIENVRFKRNWIWDVLEIDWRDISITLNGNKINLPSSVVIPFRYKFRARKLLRKQPLLSHVMLKQGKTFSPKSLKLFQRNKFIYLSIKNN